VRAQTAGGSRGYMRLPSRNFWGTTRPTRGVRGATGLRLARTDKLRSGQLQARQREAALPREGLQRKAHLLQHAHLQGVPPEGLWRSAPRPTCSTGISGPLTRSPAAGSRPGLAASVGPRGASSSKKWALRESASSLAASAARPRPPLQSLPAPWSGNASVRQVQTAQGSTRALPSVGAQP